MIPVLPVLPEEICFAETKWSERHLRKIFHFDIETVGVTPVLECPKSQFQIGPLRASEDFFP